MTARCARSSCLVWALMSNTNKQNSTRDPSHSNKSRLSSIRCLWCLSLCLNTTRICCRGKKLASRLNLYRRLRMVILIMITWRRNSKSMQDRIGLRLEPSVPDQILLARFSMSIGFLSFAIFIKLLWCSIMQQWHRM